MESAGLRIKYAVTQRPNPLDEAEPCLTPRVENRIQVVDHDHEKLR
jgi:hypothetical protein